MHVREDKIPPARLAIAQYATLAVQSSRGCPYDCEFCDIIVMNGRTPRYKSAPQMIAEMEAIVATGWRGRVFVVDDNFIGNKRMTAGCQTGRGDKFPERRRCASRRRVDEFSNARRQNRSGPTAGRVLNGQLSARFNC